MAEINQAELPSGAAASTRGAGLASATALRYALVTPARNEAAFIELTLQSVISQTLRPAKWVIVSDGSTDRTDELVGRYAVQHEWIELVRLPERKERHFAGKVQAFNAGYTRLRGTAFDLVGSIDADISFGPDLFSLLVERFAENPLLGVAGAPFREDGTSYDFRFSNIEHVSGACQLFRRECFEQIGGYLPVKGGGIDVIAVLTARMKGWQTRTYPERYYDHHRGMGRAASNAFWSNFNLGRKDYALGNSLLWQGCRTLYQLGRQPFVLGGCAIFLGYFWALLGRAERSVSPELMRFVRREQLQRLRHFVRV